MDGCLTVKVREHFRIINLLPNLRWCYGENGSYCSVSFDIRMDRSRKTTLKSLLHLFDGVALSHIINF